MTRISRVGDVRRLDLGYFIRPATETGTGHSRVEPVYGYLVVHPELTVIFDTGIGAADPETEEHYRPHRRPLEMACSDVGCSVEAIDMVINSHLHFDHCGANPALPGRRIVVQAAELEAAGAEAYTFSALVDFDGAIYDTVKGEAEVADGLLVVPTPGHSPGHQSLLVQAQDGTLLIAGQATDFASEYGSAQLARRASLEVGRPVGMWPDWLDRIERFDPARVVFAHDRATLAR